MPKHDHHHDNHGDRIFVGRYNQHAPDETDQRDDGNLWSVDRDSRSEYQWGYRWCSLQKPRRADVPDQAHAVGWYDAKYPGVVDRGHVK